MALQTVVDKSVISSSAKTRGGQAAKPNKNVLDEDTYTENLEKIIVRDFYPDLPKLEAQVEYLDALKKNDVVKLREIHIKYGPKRGSSATPSIYSTPATFETPDAHSKATPREIDKESGKDNTNDKSDQAEAETEAPTHNPEPDPKPEKQASDLTLDRFLAKNQSEDDASFVDILTEAQRKHRIKHAWLYDQEQELDKEKQQQLALPGPEQQAIKTGSTKVDTWTYTPKNSVMYVPDGVEKTWKEKLETPGSSREIDHLNTRYKTNPFNIQKSKEQLIEAAQIQAQNLQGRIGPDGKEILPQATPKINGYGFVATPSPRPGVEDSPLMTWGEIEGTPFRLDGSDTPRAPSGTPGPIFKIPDLPKRDRIGLELAEKASKNHRMKKAAALQRATANFSTPSPKFGSSKTDRLLNLSPAAQRLANAKLGVRTHTDKALRASYTPSPSHRLPEDKTPVSLTPGSTPGSTRSTPKGNTPRSTPTRSTSKRDNTEVTSLTDNLLNLPKRTKAKDFF